MSHIAMLENLGACKEGIKFASKYDTLQQAWDACETPSFMLWLLEKQNRERDLHRCACVFAREVLHIYEEQYPGDTRIRAAIECKEKWILGQATDAQLAAARAAARDAARDAAWDAARDAQCNQIRSVVPCI